MHKRTKELSISKKVKERVWERDEYQCILCGSNEGMPCAHYISRSQGGLGIEENIVTLCYLCHQEYDNSEKRPILKPLIKSYLQSKYFGWDEQKLIYRKWSYVK